MGYQESFIFTNRTNVEKNNEDVEKIMRLFEKYDVRVTDDNLAECVAKLTFKKGMGVFKKGMDVLWITGERHCQRDGRNLFDIDGEFGDVDNIKDKMDTFMKDEKEIIKRIKIIFLDNIGHLMEKIVPAIQTGNNEYVEYEPLNLMPERPMFMDKFEELAEKIKPTEEKIEDDFNGTIFGLEEFDSYERKLKEVCSELELPLKRKIERIEQLNVDKYLYFINDELLATYHETPHMEKKGSWYIRCSGQDLRRMARTVEKEKIG